MSLQYIIDGYNIINHPTYIRHTSNKIKDSRIALIESLRQNRLCGSPKNKITVVFDGFSDLPESQAHKYQVDMVFSRNISADEYIKRKAESSANPKNITVVSDDKEIKFFITAAGARILCVEEFLSPLEKRARHRYAELEPKLTYTQMQKINQELRQLWLK